MNRYVSTKLFAADFSAAGATSEAFALKSARELGFREAWLQLAIKQNPELVIAPCRAAELTDEQWHFWAREVQSGAGPIDVLLVSESGRVAIVETKLSTNTEGRRKVLAQLLDYAVQFPERELDRLPSLPANIDVDRVEERIREGDFLLIIAGDQLDPRVIKLSRALLGDYMVNKWDLALVEVAVFESTGTAAPTQRLLVPHLRGVVVPEVRQIVKLSVDHDAMTTHLERPSVATSEHRQVWDERRFLDAVKEHANYSDWEPGFRDTLKFIKQTDKLAIVWNKTRQPTFNVEVCLADQRVKVLWVSGGAARFSVNRAALVRHLGEPEMTTLLNEIADYLEIPISVSPDGWANLDNGNNGNSYLDVRNKKHRDFFEKWLVELRDALVTGSP